MNNEIEKFLRQIAEQSRRSMQQAQDDDVIDAEIIEDDYLDSRSDEADGILSGQSVSEHVAGHYPSSALGSPIKPLESTIQLADDQMDAHLHEVFEHKLGALGSATSRADDSTMDSESRAKPAGRDSMPMRMADLLRSPRTLQTAIILNEILQRPEQRWESDTTTRSETGEGPA